MIDISPPTATGLDLGLHNTQTNRAANILSIQYRSLEYAQELGIDLSFFLKDDFQFQNSSFKAYLVTTLANQGINVATLIDVVENLMHRYTFNLKAEEISTGFVAG